MVYSFLYALDADRSLFQRLIQASEELFLVEWLANAILFDDAGHH
jgi:hypothetical protein